MVSGITGISGMNSYRISSIHGNPYTLNPVSEITEQTEQSGRPLVIAADKKDELYVKDYGELKNRKYCNRRFCGNAWNLAGYAGRWNTTGTAATKHINVLL